MRPSKKLDWKHLGPFKIAKHIGLQLYKLALPAFMHHIRNTFHISLLNLVRGPAISPHRYLAVPPAAYIKNAQEYFGRRHPGFTSYL